MAVTELKYHQLTEKIIGCAMKVHRYLGPGFPEKVYKRALLIELQKLSLKCSSEIEREIRYEGQLISKRRLDLMIETSILTELKAVVEIDNRCYAQIINYLRVFHIEVGLLLNFGAPSLQFKRFINTNQSVKPF
jgi:GxxExxY protein